MTELAKVIDIQTRQEIKTDRQKRMGEIALEILLLQSELARLKSLEGDK